MKIEKFKKENTVVHSFHFTTPYGLKVYYNRIMYEGIGQLIGGVFRRKLTSEDIIKIDGHIYSNVYNQYGHKVDVYFELIFAIDKKELARLTDISINKIHDLTKS